LLLIAGFYSGVFVLLPLALVAAPELLRLLRRCWRTRMVWPLAAVFAVPLFLCFGRLQGHALWWAPVRLHWIGNGAADAGLSLAAYLLAVSVVDLAGMPLVVAAYRRRLTRAEVRYGAGALGFLVCTWGVESIGFNNFCMRGMMLPVVIFGYLFARVSEHLSRPRQWAAAALAVLLSFGTLREAAHLTYQPLMFSALYWRVRGLPPPPGVAAQLREAYPRLARTPGVRYYEPDAGNRSGLDKFNAEKPVRGLPVAEMSEAELELARAPLRGWLW
jgi:hypothetical protein